MALFHTRAMDFRSGVVFSLCQDHSICSNWQNQPLCGPSNGTQRHQQILSFIMRSLILQPRVSPDAAIKPNETVEVNTWGRHLLSSAVKRCLSMRRTDVVMFIPADESLQSVWETAVYFEWRKRKCLVQHTQGLSDTPNISSTRIFSNEWIPPGRR